MMMCLKRLKNYYKEGQVLKGCGRPIMSRPRSKEINDAACTCCTRFLFISSAGPNTLEAISKKSFGPSQAQGLP